MHVILLEDDYIYYPIDGPDCRDSDGMETTATPALALRSSKESERRVVRRIVQGRKRHFDGTRVYDSTYSGVGGSGELNSLLTGNVSAALQYNAEIETSFIRNSFCAFDIHP